MHTMMSATPIADVMDSDHRGHLNTQSSEILWSTRCTDLPHYVLTRLMWDVIKSGNVRVLEFLLNSGLRWRNMGLLPVACVHDSLPVLELVLSVERIDSYQWN